eukprot:TRINITY_DN5193_c1_g1_i2.p1 TRINITY_DN5193_c1_g1~~TRINITY_DN5193_c1_g1_i2.p1  ORF type:complete len:303 (-),score=-25.65 TRINITY_DN5193_c1_g1_i2:174-1082(-)
MGMFSNFYQEYHFQSGPNNQDYFITNKMFDNINLQTQYVERILRLLRIFKFFLLVFQVRFSDKKVLQVDLFFNFIRHEKINRSKLDFTQICMQIYALIKDFLLLVRSLQEIYGLYQRFVSARARCKLIQLQSRVSIVIFCTCSYFEIMKFLLPIIKSLGAHIQLLYVQVVTTVLNSNLRIYCIYLFKSGCIQMLALLCRWYVWDLHYYSQFYAPKYKLQSRFIIVLIQILKQLRNFGLFYYLGACPYPISLKYAFLYMSRTTYPSQRFLFVISLNLVDNLYELNFTMLLMLVIFIIIRKNFQ